MKKTVLTVGIALFGLAACAEETAPAPSRPPRSALVRAAQMRRFGGLVVRPDSGRGRIAVVDAGTDRGEEIARTVAAFAKEIKIHIEVTAGERPALGTASALRAKTGAEAVLFVTDDAGLPALLSAPEDRWVIVNVARLADGAATPETVGRRVRCEVARGLALLSGAAASMFPNSLMSAVTGPKDLDTVSDEIPPAEVFARMPGYLKGFGITPTVAIPYRTACEEGWAPAPTNDAQRAIWEKVHAIPANPMRIEFDPKRGR